MAKTLDNKSFSNQNRGVKKSKGDSPKLARVVKKTANSKPLEDWISVQKFPVNATVHVNGPSSEAAIITVDFGSPLEGPVKMSPDQTSDLTELMKEVAAEFYTPDASIRVSYDPSNGVYWASLI